ncbi:hypothetical protein Vretifemale_606 [Volvox reticuliferus]|uniref:Uncharacterized protein n=1 Tax=Volvox reticuliferus TaxID=1737510 RepID=A0A8J4FCV4_9CHLO|nr:hypothetical protein Vretifemale_606 [Volvox reticuliferus]
MVAAAAAALSISMPYTHGIVSCSDVCCGDDCGEAEAEAAAGSSVAEIETPPTTAAALVLIPPRPASTRRLLPLPPASSPRHSPPPPPLPQEELPPPAVHPPPPPVVACEKSSSRERVGVPARSDLWLRDCCRITVTLRTGRLTIIVTESLRADTMEAGWASFRKKVSKEP